MQVQYLQMTDRSPVARDRLVIAHARVDRFVWEVATKETSQLQKWGQLGSPGLVPHIMSRNVASEDDVIKLKQRPQD